MARFPKKQKLCSEKAIDRLFETGESISEAPFRAVWGLEKNKDNSLIKVLIVVSKKRIKLATSRNILKRRIRESYRLQKRNLESLLTKNKQQIILSIIYQQEKILSYKVLEKKINLLLNRLIKQL